MKQPGEYTAALITENGVTLAKPDWQEFFGFRNAQQVAETVAEQNLVSDTSTGVVEVRDHEDRACQFNVTVQITVKATATLVELPNAIEQLAAACGQWKCGCGAMNDDRRFRCRYCSFPRHAAKGGGN